jgi:hypothetical protein
MRNVGFRALENKCFSENKYVSADTRISLVAPSMQSATHSYVVKRHFHFAVSAAQPVLLLSEKGYTENQKNRNSTETLVTDLQVQIAVSVREIDCCS